MCCSKSYCIQVYITSLARRIPELFDTMSTYPGSPSASFLYCRAVLSVYPASDSEVLNEAHTTGEQLLLSSVLCTVGNFLFFFSLVLLLR